MKPKKPTYKIPHYRLRLVRERTVSYPVQFVENGAEAVAVMHKLLDGADREMVVVLYMNGRGVPIGSETVAVGGLHGVGVTQREVFKGAIVASADRIILGHNHPSGDPTPSEQDKEFTKMMVEAGKVLGIPVIDHVIVCANGRHKSFYELGLMPGDVKDGNEPTHG